MVPTEEEMKAAEEYLKKHPKYFESQSRKEELEAFKAKYHVERRTKLHCPLCSEWANLGVLFQSTDEPDLFVCKKCLKSIRISSPDFQSVNDFLDGLDEESRLKREKKKAERTEEERQMDLRIQEALNESKVQPELKTQEQFISDYCEGTPHD